MAGHLLAVMGSGETAPTMVEIHKRLIARAAADDPAGTAVLLETPYGFQENAADITSRAQAYFARSVGVAVASAGLRATVDAAPDRPDAATEDSARGVATVLRARWLFAGPGSPTYALRQWTGSPVAEALRERMHRPGVTVFSSAAACTVGRLTLPVYEIYKVGQEPAWLPGLDLLAAFGISAAVIPHFDNAEGGSHDTRFCYLGERRLRVMEAQLPPDAGVLGVDEHTAALFDGGRREVRVQGRGALTVRRAGQSTEFRAGTKIAFTTLSDLLTGRGAGNGRPRTPGRTPPAPAEDAGRAPAGRVPARREDAGSPTEAARAAGSLSAAAEAAERDFATARDRGDGPAMARAVLELEATLADWSADTLQSDEADRARAALRRMVIGLGELAAEGLKDPRSVLAPAVEPLLAFRGERRAAGDFAVADRIRDWLGQCGIDVLDAADGPRWTLAGRPVPDDGR